MTIIKNHARYTLLFMFIIVQCVNHEVWSSSAHTVTSDSDAKAQLNLGLCYENGKGVNEDIYKAIKCYKNAATHGNKFALDNVVRIAGLFSINYYQLPFKLVLGIPFLQGKDYYGNPKNREEYIEFYQLQCAFKKALKLYNFAADQGHPKAQYHLGTIYENGDVVGRDLKKTVHFYQLSAQQKCAEAQCQLALLYKYGDGVPKDVTKAFELLELSAFQSYPPADFNLALLYKRGEGCLQDPKEALQLMERSADGGYNRARMWLAAMYEIGDGVEKNLETAIEYYKRAAMYGDKNALERLAIIGHDHFLRNGNKKEALELFQWASDKDGALAQLILANMYTAGNGVEKKVLRASELYQRAIAQGYRDAISPLAVIGEDFIKRGYCMRGFLVYKWLADHTDDAEIQYKVACMCEKEYRDYNVSDPVYHSCNYYLLSAENGYVVARQRLAHIYKSQDDHKKHFKSLIERYIKEQSALAEMYRTGGFYDVPAIKDLSKAFKIYDMLADIGYAPAQCNLGQMYYWGQGVEMNWAKAFGLFQLAADQQLPEAEFALGQMYYFGHGVLQDYNKAFNLFDRLNAYDEIPLARYYLAEMIQYGLCVEPDLLTALGLYFEAANLNLEPAKSRVKSYFSLPQIPLEKEEPDRMGDTLRTTGFSGKEFSRALDDMIDDYSLTDHTDMYDRLQLFWSHTKKYMRLSIDERATECLLIHLVTTPALDDAFAQNLGGVWQGICKSYVKGIPLYSIGKNIVYEVSDLTQYLTKDTAQALRDLELIRYYYHDHVKIDKLKNAIPIIVGSIEDQIVNNAPVRTKMTAIIYDWLIQDLL
jgi:TPR repeat protein